MMLIKSIYEITNLQEGMDDTENSKELADCQMILQLLFDNLRLWSSEDGDGDTTNGKRLFITN